MIHYRFPGRPVPAPRQTRNAGWTPEVKNYHAYRNALQSALQAAYPELVDHGPEAGTRERSKWLAVRKNWAYKLLIDVYLEPKQFGDWDNFGKTIGDMLQRAGFIDNDRKIKDGHVRVHDNSDNPRVEIHFERIEHAKTAQAGPEQMTFTGVL